MKIKRPNSGYTAETFKKYIGSPRCRILLGSGLEAKLKYDNEAGKYTGEVESTRLQCYFPNLGADWVKFPADFSLPEKKDDLIDDLQEIELINPTACEVRGQLYIKADKFKVL